LMTPAARTRSDFAGVPEISDDGAAVWGQDEADDWRDLLVGDLAAPAREDGLDKATRIFGLEAADLVVAQAMVVQQRSEFRRGPQAGRCVASRWHDPGARQGLEDAEVDQPGQQRAVDRVIDEHAAGPEYPGGLFDDSVKVRGDLERIGVVGEVEGLVRQAELLGGRGFIRDGQVLALVRFPCHRGRGGRGVDGDHTEPQAGQAARQQPAAATYDQGPAPRGGEGETLHGARHVLQADVLEGDGPDLPAIDSIWYP